MNYWIDFYGVFRGVNQKVIENSINDRFVKMEYLLQNNNFEKYDSFLWGSSRIQKMDPQIARPHMYNMGSFGGMPEDCLRNLSVLLEHGYKPQVVYLGLDDISYMSDWNWQIKRGIVRTPYSEMTVQRVRYYGELLLHPILAYDGLKRKFSGYQGGETFLQTNGMYLVPKRVETAIENRPNAYVKHKKFLTSSASKARPNKKILPIV